MNFTRLRNRRIDHDNIDDLVATGLITPEQAEAITEDFERNLHPASHADAAHQQADGHAGHHGLHLQAHHHHRCLRRDA